MPSVGSRSALPSSPRSRSPSSWCTRCAPALSRASAVRDALGIDVPRRRLPMLRILLAPFSVTRRDVAHTANVSYGDAGAANRLDVYRPRAGPSTGCVLIHFHGGGFRSGRKNREARPLIYRLASEGWLCVSANYRLRPVSFYESLDDAERVVKWLREHAADYGTVATHVFVSGSSAGGHLATTAAFRDPSIAGAISLYGYYGPADGGSAAHLTARLRRP